MTEAKRIEDEAAEWLLRQDGDGWTAEDGEALESWLQADVAHEVAYYRLEYGWCAADRLSALRRPEQATPPGLRFWRPFAIAASLLVVCLTGILGYSLLNPEKPRSYVTAVGGHSVVPLADGSLVELNTDTELTADLGKDRKVVLSKGEAFFDVAHDATRPFEVLAGRHRILVVGTKFSVRLSGRDVQVNVLEGRIRIIPAAPAGGRAGDAVRSLSAGEIAIISNGAELVTSRSRDRVVDALSWRDGVLLFDQDTIEDAAAEFNRYNEKKLIVRDPRVRTATISGRFQAGNVDAFGRLLSRAYGFEIRETPAGIEILE